MTIAACYVSPEGVVFGADSTASYNLGGFHYYNHNQKLFEIGENATIAIVTWGLGSLGPLSYRTLFAQLADDLRTTPPADMQQVAGRWAAIIWNAYSSPTLADMVQDRAECHRLNGKPAYDANANPPDPAARTQVEENEFRALVRGLQAGFCIGGYLESDRRPRAFEVVTQGFDIQAPTAVEIPMNTHRFWGAPSMTDRLIYGCDMEFVDRLMTSGKWTGTRQELDALIIAGALNHPILPIREAIDFVHTCIYSTIKAMKFSALSQICGGPIELAVITTDRKFRWVRHKDWDAAVSENG